MKRLRRCSQCHYEWEPRARNPKQCPRCKRYDWKPALAAFVRHAEPNKPLESPAKALPEASRGVA